MTTSVSADASREAWHGRKYGYEIYGCRCDDCTQAAIGGSCVICGAPLQRTGRKGRPTTVCSLACRTAREAARKPKPPRKRTTLCNDCGSEFSGAECPRCKRVRELARRAQTRYRRRLGMRPREEYFNDMRSRRKHGTKNAYNKGCRCNECRTATTEYGRRRRPPTFPPTLHEKAWENWQIRQGAGFRIAKCKCGCGLYVNAAHVAVSVLYERGLTLREIADQLGVPYLTVRWLKSQANKRAWAWYRKGHQRKNTPRQPRHLRHYLPRKEQIAALVEEQQDDSTTRAKSTASLSLDAPHRGTDDFALADTVAAPTETGAYTDTEEALFDWLIRHNIDLESLADRCLDDRELAAAMAEATETGQITDAVAVLLLTESKAA